MKLNKLQYYIFTGLLIFSIESCKSEVIGKNASEKVVVSLKESIIAEVLEITEFENSIIEQGTLFTDRDLIQNPDLTDATRMLLKDGSEILIEEEGLYILEGDVVDTFIVIDVPDNAKVQLILDNLTIINKDIPTIYVKSADKVYITTLSGNSTLSVTGKYRSNNEVNLDAVIFSKSDLVLNGIGALDILSKYGNGISSKDDLKITGGTLNIDSSLDGLEANDSIRIYNGNISIKSGADALHSENDNDPLLGYIYMQNGVLNIIAADDAIRGTSFIQIDGGNINIETCQEGIEATQILINGGTIKIYATDDGINATAKSPMDVLIEVYGGDISIKMASGDTDGFDSNGDLYIYGGTIDFEGGSSFDADGTAELVKGDVTINGELVTELPENRQGRRKR
ncbi:MAG: carbohydrate-binding domain-containing protein [Spirochaetaceae bacterium]